MRIGTYSIVARDPESGQIGVAVQSHWFSVGPIVAWARTGVGAVATQSIAEPAYGPKLLDRLARDETAQAALAALVAIDEQGAFRQVAVVDALGRVACHTGERCIAHAGDTAGDGYSAQANMMASPGVWPAMARAFESATGPLARRLMAALHAAEAAGGDVRGRQSAALLVVPGEGAGWEMVRDLRVDDSDGPLAELDRLLDLADAYELAGEADDLAGQGRHDQAGELYVRASALAPGNHELVFWSGLAAAQAGDMPLALERVRKAIASRPAWAELLERLEPDIAPGAQAVREALAAE